MSTNVDVRVYKQLVQYTTLVLNNLCYCCSTNGKTPTTSFGHSTVNWRALTKLSTGAIVLSDFPCTSLTQEVLCITCRRGAFAYARLTTLRDS
jgi:hypothetical protein